GHGRESRSLTALLPLLVLLVAALLVVQSWNLFSRVGLPSVRLDPSAAPRPIAPAGDLAEDEKATISLFKQSSHSVVHITTSEIGRDYFTLNETELATGTGSGFIWDEQGPVVTNYHVVEDASRRKVTLADQTTGDAALVGAASAKDLAVLKISVPAGQLPPPADRRQHRHLQPQRRLGGNRFRDSRRYGPADCATDSASWACHSAVAASRFLSRYVYAATGNQGRARGPRGADWSRRPSRRA